MQGLKCKKMWQKNLWQKYTVLKEKKSIYSIAFPLLPLAQKYAHITTKSFSLYPLCLLNAVFYVAKNNVKKMTEKTQGNKKNDGKSPTYFHTQKV